MKSRIQTRRLAADYLSLVRSILRVIISILVFIALTASMADSKDYRILESAQIFAIGGIGREGTITKEETAFDAICKEPDAAQQFRKLLREATIEGQMYALLGLRQLHATDYKAEADRYRRSVRIVKTGSGCEIGPEKVGYVVNEWVDKMPLK